MPYRDRSTSPPLNSFPTTSARQTQPPQGLFVTDLDGTLARTDGSLGQDEREALEELGRRKIVRVVATGRSLYSLRKVLRDDWPLDYLIFSSGAGLLNHPQGQLLRQISMASPHVEQARQICLQSGCHFMIHRPVPDNHYFAYHPDRYDHPDFVRRLELYHGFGQPLSACPLPFGEASQLLAMAPDGQTPSLLQHLRLGLPSLNVIQTTSPLDGISFWLEIFPPSVSKSLAAEWLRHQLQIDARQILATGNDYNDLDLLQWAPTAFVVNNAPPPLQERFPAVASHQEGGVAQAIQRWLSSEKNP